MKVRLVVGLFKYRAFALHCGLDILDYSGVEEADEVLAKLDFTNFGFIEKLFENIFISLKDDYEEKLILGNSRHSKKWGLFAKLGLFRNLFQGLEDAQDRLT